MDPEIDVVIPTRDRPALLAECLESLLDQTFRAFRVILVDDASRVAVNESLPDRLRQLPGLQILRHEHSAGPSACRNRAVKAGSAPYIVFLDDDCRAHPDLLGRHRTVLGADARIVSIGSLHPPPTIRSRPWNVWQADRLARQQAAVARGEESPGWTHFYTGNVAVRRDDFVATGGFDERLARQEDIAMGFRLGQLGCRFVFEPEAVAWHETQRSLKAWLELAAETARYDVLMDRIIPESERLRSVREELGRRHWLLRAARRSLGSPVPRRLAVRLSAAIGMALHGLGANRTALLPFSLVWDLEYTRALAQATDGEATAAGGRAQ